MTEMTDTEVFRPAGPGVSRPQGDAVREGAVMSAVRALRRAVVRGPLGSRLRAAKMRRLPDRRYMEEQILPTLAALKAERALSIGIAYFTRHYGDWFAAVGVEFWTLDISPEAAAFGAKGRHVVGDVLEADRHFEAGSVGVALLNGVIGWGVDSAEDADLAVRALRRVLLPGGVLLVGWNRDRSADPSGLPALREHFTHEAVESLPPRKTFAESTHVYDVFRAR